MHFLAVFIIYRHRFRNILWCPSICLCFALWIMVWKNRKQMQSVGVGGGGYSKFIYLFIQYFKRVHTFSYKTIQPCGPPYKTNMNIKLCTTINIYTYNYSGYVLPYYISKSKNDNPFKQRNWLIERPSSLAKYIAIIDSPWTFKRP